MRIKKHRRPIAVGAATLICILVFGGCGKNSDQSSSTPTGTSGCANATQGANPALVTTSGTNQIPVYIADPANTGSIGYSNEPLVSVTLCTPNHTSSSQCATISNILLDTGSFGLRIFSTAIPSNVVPSQETVSWSGSTFSLAELASFGSANMWGGISKVDVLLGNQQATNIPMQVVNIKFGVIPSQLAKLNPATNPCDAQAGFNGILGVGIFPQDCGSDCASSNTSINSGQYFACSSSQCFDLYTSSVAVSVTLANQVTNPVSALSAPYNGGLLLTLPSIGTGGSTQIQGTVTLGITASGVGDAPGGAVVAYPADSTGMTDCQLSSFQTVYNGTTYGSSTGCGDGTNNELATQAYLDSGSNSIIFGGGTGASNCSGNTWFCTGGSVLNFNATMKGYSGSPSKAVSFSVGDATTLFSSGNSAFNDLAADAGSCGSGTGVSCQFDWGLPWFYGKSIYVGISGNSPSVNGSTAGVPFWAF